MANRPDIPKIDLPQVKQNGKVQVHVSGNMAWKAAQGTPAVIVRK